MLANFPIALKLIAGVEGGYSNHPKDPGGPTMKGVTLATYTAYRRQRGKPVPSIGDLKAISDAEVQDIFKRQYWDAVRGDELPAGVDIFAADFGFNSGGAQAVTELQRTLTALGFDTQGADGKFGDHTRAALVAAMRGAGEDRVINAYADRRLAFMQSLRTWPTFKNGWTTRVREMRKNALAIAHGDPTFQPTAGTLAKADSANVKTTALPGAKSVLTSVGGTVAAGATAGAQQILSNSAYQPPSYLIYAVLGFLALTAIAGLVAFFALRGRADEGAAV